MKNSNKVVGVFALLVVFLMSFSVVSAYFEYDNQYNAGGTGSSIKGIDHDGSNLYVLSVSGASSPYSFRLVKHTLGGTYVSQSDYISSSRWYIGLTYNDNNDEWLLLDSNNGRLVTFYDNFTLKQEYTDNVPITNSHGDMAYDDDTNRIYLVNGGSTVRIYSSDDYSYIGSTTLSVPAADYSPAPSLAIGVIMSGDKYIYMKTMAQSNPSHVYVFDKSLNYMGVYGDVSDTNHRSGTFYNDKLYMGRTGDYTYKTYTNLTDNIDIENYYDGEFYASGFCIDDNYYCNETIYVEQSSEVIFYCNSDDRSLCTGNDGCVNSRTYSDDLGGYYNYGTCDMGDCSNECDFVGLDTCNSLTTYRTCGNFDSDNCLEYGDSIQCNSGYFCNEELASGASQYYPCTIFNTSVSDINIPLFEFTLQAKQTDSETTKYDVDDNDNIQVQTTNSINLMKYRLISLFTWPDVETDLGYSLYCDYDEDVIETDNINYVDPSSEWTSTATLTTEVIDGDRRLKINETDVLYKSYDTQNDNNKISYDIYLGNDDNSPSNLSVSITDNSNTIAQLYLLRNETAKTLTTYISNSTSDLADLFFTDISSSSVDDLEKINIEIITDYTTGIESYTYKIVVTRISGEETYYSSPLSFYSANPVSNTRLNINPVNSDSAWLDNFLLTDIPAYKGFSLADFGSYTLQCVYNTESCKTARAFVSYGDIPTFHVYDEVTTCNNFVETISEGVTDVEDNGIFGDLSSTTKLLLALFTALATIIFGFAVSTTNGFGSWVLAMSIGIAAGEIIYFAVIGWIPAFVAVIVFLIAAGFLAVGAKRTFGGG